MEIKLMMLVVGIVGLICLGVALKIIFSNIALIKTCLSISLN